MTVHIAWLVQGYIQRNITLTRREVPFDGMNVRAHAVNTNVSGRLNSAKSLHGHADYLKASMMRTIPIYELSSR